MVDRIELSTDDIQAQENLPQDGENLTTEQPASERPEWLPEKFNNPEDLAKAYGELEKKQSQGSDQNAVEQVVENAGLKLEDLTAEFEESGGLSDDSYTKLEQAGITKDYVDAYIQGQQALVDQYQSTVFNEAGGKDGYHKMIEWAGRNLDAQAVEAFNKSVNSGDQNQALLAVKGLYSQYSLNEGNEPNLVSGGAGNDSGSVFRSTSELVSAMKDSRYQNDPAYRQDVISRLGRSNII